jgi:hypothetical protein
MIWRALFTAMVIVCGTCAAAAQGIENTDVTVEISDALRLQGFELHKLIVYGSKTDTKIEMVVNAPVSKQVIVEVVDPRDSVIATFRDLPINQPIEPQFAGDIGYAMEVVDVDVTAVSRIRITHRSDE